MSRNIRFSQAIQEATDICMAADPRVYLMGLGVPDPKGMFGTTAGLADKYGDERVCDMPTSENGMTGVAIGTTIAGMRPILAHHRVDFTLLAMEQMVNQAAKWHYMFAGALRMPLVVRMLIGRGWGQGPQHAQSLQAWFAHVPGLKVVMPTTPHDAKGLLISSIEDDNPVMFLEHRWLHNIVGDVPAGAYRVPIGRARVMREGTDVTMVGVSYMALEASRAADYLADVGVSAEVIDLRSLRPWDEASVLASVRKTGRLIVTDTGWSVAGFAAEVLARVLEEGVTLKAPPRRMCLPESPTPSTPALATRYYPRFTDLVAAAAAMVGVAVPDPPPSSVPLDIPDPAFTGPF